MFALSKFGAMSRQPEVLIQYTNLLLNSNFATDSESDGVADNWTNGGSLLNLSVSDNTQFFTGAGSPAGATGFWFSQANAFLNVGNKYFIRLSAKRLNSAVDNKLYIGNGWVVNLGVVIATEFIDYGVIITLGSANQPVVFGSDNGLQIAIKQALVVDLTTSGYAVNDLAWCMANLPYKA